MTTSNRPLATVPLYRHLQDRHHGRVRSVYLQPEKGVGPKALEAFLAKVGAAQGLVGQEDLLEVLWSVEVRRHGLGLSSGRGVHVHAFTLTIVP